MGCEPGTVILVLLEQIGTTFEYWINIKSGLYFCTVECDPKGGRPLTEVQATLMWELRV